MGKTTVCAKMMLICDDFDTERVSAEMGVQPTYLRKNGEMLRNGRVSDWTCWGIDTGYVESLDVEEVLQKTLALIDGGAEAMYKISRELDAEWKADFVVEIEEGRAPAICFSRETINFLAEINANVDMDVYVLSDGRRFGMVKKGKKLRQ